jgi:general secretion pathway protein C
MVKGMTQISLAHFTIPVSRLVTGVNVVLVLLLAYSFADLTWRFLPGDQESIAPAGSVAPGTAEQPVSAPGLEAVAAMHLLGQADAQEVAPRTEAIDAPKTRLNLSLKGVFAGDELKGAVAIIASGGTNEKAYHVGDVIAGAARIHQILPDRVILERAGKFETLLLPRDIIDSSNLTPPPHHNSSVPVSSTRQLSRRVPEVQKALQQGPQQALQLIQAQPVMEGGALKGFVVRPGKNRVLFARAGLRPGDVVTAVNGQALSNDFSKMEALYQRLKSAASVNVTIERGGRPMSLSLRLR